jgi:hypothetical protein
MGRRSRKIPISLIVFTCWFWPASGPVPGSPAECRLAHKDCAYPFPDDRLLAKSNRSASGRKWAFPPGDYQGLWALANADGFSPTSHIWLEAPCNLKGRFPDRFGGDPAQPFWLWNTGIERSVPLTVKFHKTEKICLLEVIPEEALRAGNTHLLVIRGLVSQENRAVELSTAFDQQDPGDPLYGERVALLPGGVPRAGIQTIVQVTARSYENLLGTFLHLRNTSLARFEPEDASLKLERVASTNGSLVFHGRVSLPWICKRELTSGVCRFRISPNGRTVISESSVNRTFFVSIPAGGAAGTLLIPALAFQQPDIVVGLSGVQDLLSQSRLAAFGFTDQRSFLSQNRTPMDGLPPSLPGFFLSPTDHDRLTSLPDREAVRIIHGILLTRLMKNEIPAELSRLLGRRVRFDSTNGLALETERDAFALAVNPFVEKVVVVAASIDPRGLPFGPRGTLPEREFVRLFWDGAHFANYAPILKSRKAMPDTRPQQSLNIGSLLIEADRRDAIRFLKKQ